MSELDQRKGPPYATSRRVLEGEVRVDTYRASGPGGQHVNRTESAVRLTHFPSGVAVAASDSRSQHRNRDIAFERLAEKLRQLNKVPKKRRPTRVGAGVKARRLDAKRKHSNRKRSRGKVADD